jgi:hypothetical protein
LFDVRALLPDQADREQKDGLRIFSLTSALIAVSAGFFTGNPTDARTALLAIRDASDILPELLDGGHSVVAGRLAGALRNIGRDRIIERPADRFAT